MTAAATPRLGLRDLPRVTLREEHERALARVPEEALGSAAWKALRHNELRELFALEVIAASRLQVLQVECSTELHAVVRLQVAVPTLPAGADDLVVRSQADLALHYREPIIRGPVPGHSVIEVLQPRAVWHPNVAAGPVQAVCLGVSLPRAYPLREALLATYAALSLQNLTVDERSHVGVMNTDAALWWQARMERMPLSTEPFLPFLGTGSATREETS